MVNKEVYQSAETEPRFFYGYVVVVAAFFIFMAAFGLSFTYGVFFKPLLTEFGWTRAVTSGAFSLQQIISGVMGIVIGGLVDRFGPRIVLTFCGCLLGLGYLLMSQTSALWQINLFYGVIAGIGMGGIWVSVMSTVSRWFVRRRSQMTGIVIAGSGIGQVIASPVTSRLIAAYDWRLTFVILGGIALLIVVIAAQFLRRDPAQKGQLPYGEGENTGKQHGLEDKTEGFSLKEAIYTGQFWIVAVMFFFFGFLMFATMVHIVPHATDLGVPAISAANLLSVWGVMIIIGGLLGGIVGDRIGNRRVFIIGFAMLTISVLWLVLARDLWVLYLFVIIFGFASGGMGSCEVPLVAGVFGVRFLGSLAGFFSLAVTVGAAVGPLVTGYIFDLTGRYLPAFWALVAISAVTVVLAVILRPTKRLGVKL